MRRVGGAARFLGMLWRRRFGAGKSERGGAARCVRLVERLREGFELLKKMGVGIPLLCHGRR